MATGQEVNNHHALTKITLQQAEPPAHMHAIENEAYSILKGTIRYQIGETVNAVMDQSMYSLDGCPHSFKYVLDIVEVL